MTAAAIPSPAPPDAACPWVPNVRPKGACFDAEAPFTPRPCVAQARSVAELLRCWRLTGDPTE